jgi:ubiquinone/menaquinone biosynthesis C-methylase UbiE
MTLFRDHPLCASEVPWPAQFWGPEPFHEASWEQFGRRLEPDRERAALAAALSPADSLLDVGGGDGLLTSALTRQGRTCVALEPKPKLLRELSRLHGVNVVAGNAEQLPFRSGAFDAVMACWILQYVSGPAAAVHEMGRVCAARAGARVAIVQAAPWNDLVALYNLCAAWFGQPEAHHGYLLATAAAILEAQGFAVGLSVLPVAMRFREADPSARVRIAAQITASLQFEPSEFPAELEAQLQQYVQRSFAKSGDALVDDGVLLLAVRN